MTMAGFPGGTLERPALKRLIADIEAKEIDVVVVYKIDRLSRALMDFARLVEVFDRNEVTFVSVTQSFNTTTSMGRLTLNVLLSLPNSSARSSANVSATSSRPRGAKACGWAGGLRSVTTSKIANLSSTSRKQVSSNRFSSVCTRHPAALLIDRLAKEGALNKNGKPIDKGYLYRVLNNRVYLGEAVHKGTPYPGEHPPIIEPNLWDQVHSLIGASPRARPSVTGTNAGITERSHLRTNWHTHDARPHPKAAGFIDTTYQRTP